MNWNRGAVETAISIANHPPTNQKIKLEKMRKEAQPGKKDAPMTTEEFEAAIAAHGMKFVERPNGEKKTHVDVGGGKIVYAYKKYISNGARILEYLLEEQKKAKEAGQ
jgi:hypothetical protein